jgi:hypothetical protein
MEVIYICCDEGEVGVCDEEDRRKLEALAGQTSSAGRSKAVKCEVISDLEIEKSGDKLPNGDTNLEDPINDNNNGKKKMIEIVLVFFLTNNGEVKSVIVIQTKKESFFFLFCHLNVQKMLNDL